jgi:PucR-like helix-turn-helix protein/diguanylate cyclase with GGDEF domain
MTTAGQASADGTGPSAGPGGPARLETPADPVALAAPGALPGAGGPGAPADLGSPPPAGRVREETVSRLQEAMGSLGTAAMASMEQRLPWFRGMSAEHRSWIGLVAQAGIAAFVDWVKHPERSRSAVAGEVFGTAPRELARAVSLQQVVEMVRVTIDVVEARVDELAAPGGEAELREAVLHYTREVAFAAARVYARTAEARGAWDARLEALVVDSLVRGEVGEGVHSWASALNWSSAPVTVIVGTAEGDEPEGLIDELRVTARRARLDLLAGVHGNKLVVVLGGTDDPLTAVQRFAGRFGPGPLVVGPVVTDLYAATSSAAAAMAGMRAAPAWPDAPRPVLASDLLPERALDGDETACAELIEEIYQPLLSGGSALIDTVMTYLEQGFSLEAAARLLFVHPNTVRYRLRRVSELTGLVPTQGRGGFTLWVAIVLGRLIHKRT